MHSDHHALWINPANPKHLINGNDGGVNISYDDGDNWIKNNSPSVGQFYYINYDHEKPYNVYGGLQDNGVWKGAHNARINKSWEQSGDYPWKSIMGGDGMQVQIDKRDPNTVYTGFQFGNYFRLNLESGKQKYIQPKHNLGEAPYRFNWQTPIVLSSHNQDILYLGGNKLMRSMNKGDDWEAISPDLTTGGKKGNVAYGTLTAISESPFQFGFIYTGSDDGLVQVTKNSGGSWTNVSSAFPKDLWVSRVIASKHAKERVYVTLNGYRWDDFNTYIYVSEDAGLNWTSISKGIPMSAVNAIAEDPVNADLLYVGTDNGAYVSFNRGASWEAFSSGLPSVAIHDIKVQPDANDLLLGTHGRSIYKANISPLQTLDEMDTAALSFYEVQTVRHSNRWGNSWSQWLDAYEPEVSLKFYSNSEGLKTIKILTDDGIKVYQMTTDVDKGFNYVTYNLELSDKGRKALLKANKDLTVNKASNGKYYLPKGNYKVAIDGETTVLKLK